MEKMTFVKQIRLKSLKTGKPTLPWFGRMWRRLLGSFYLITCQVNIYVPPPIFTNSTLPWSREIFPIRSYNDNARHELSERLLDSAQLSLDPAGLSFSKFEATLRLVRGALDFNLKRKGKIWEFSC